MTFIDKLTGAWRAQGSLLCVGLDPDPARFPVHWRGRSEAIFEFNRSIIDATADLACAFKPQFAHFAAAGAEQALEQTIAYLHRRASALPVILDAKRGDIGSTAALYACEAFDRYGADAVTVSPYLGGDSLAPYLARKDRGVIVLCRTSNPGAGDLQDLEIDGTKLFEIVADKAAREWNAHGNVSLVVGATYPEELRRVRARVGAMPLLVPGVGAQGGDIDAVVRNGCTPDRTGLIISSSREILYAGDGPDFAERARDAALRIRDAINAARDRIPSTS